MDSQNELYDGVGQICVTNFCEGFNTTMFVYGQTGTGKTHTIFGADKVVNSILSGDYTDV